MMKTTARAFFRPWKALKVKQRDASGKAIWSAASPRRFHLSRSDGFVVCRPPSTVRRPAALASRLTHRPDREQAATTYGVRRALAAFTCRGATVLSFVVCRPPSAVPPRLPVDSRIGLIATKPRPPFRRPYRFLTSDKTIPE